MCKQVKDFPVLSGDGTKTLNDLFELSPKHLISKVVLEEKIFKTWFSGRTVLLGDGMFPKPDNRSMYKKTRCLYQ